MPTYPLDMPTAPLSVSLNVQRSQIGIEAFSGKLQVHKQPGDRWVGQITLNNMTESVGLDWCGFFAALDGRLGTFVVFHPVANPVRGAAKGFSLGRVAGGGQLGKTLNTNGYPPNVQGLFKRGDVIYWGNPGEEVMRIIVDDVNSDADGNAVLPLSHTPRRAPGNGYLIRIDAPRGIFRLSSEAQSMKFDINTVAGATFDIEEYLE